MKTYKSKGDPISIAEWDLWYQDNFDLECPRQISRSGQGLIVGLIELWAHHLYETIQPNGFFGFDRYNLWWKQEKRGVDIVGDLTGQLKLRKWMYGKRRSSYAGCMAIADKELIHLIAEAHSRLILLDQTSKAIVNLAIQSESKAMFCDQIKHLGMKD